jgi:TonB family protein
VNEAVDSLIAERERLDAGLPGTVLVSIVAHMLVLAGLVAAPMLMPKQPLLRVVEGDIVVLPRGGGGSPTTSFPPAPAPVARQTPESRTEPPTAPKVIKPPKEAARPNALPSLDSRKVARKAPTPAAPPLRATVGASASASAPARGGAPAGTGTASATPGLEFGPPGPGVPDGTDTGGDWYLAGVQQKIWMIWNQQIKAGFSQPIGVTFTIQPDGTVTDVRVTKPSGAALLDMAAQRAVFNAAPFGPLPREYGQNPRTIQALFRPTT